MPANSTAKKKSKTKIFEINAIVEAIEHGENMRSLDTHMSAPTNVTLRAESVCKCAAQICWIIDMRHTASLLLNIDAATLPDDSPGDERI